MADQKTREAQLRTRSGYGTEEEAQKAEAMTLEEVAGLLVTHYDWLPLYCAQMGGNGHQPALPLIANWLYYQPRTALMQALNAVADRKTQTKSNSKET